MEGYFDIMAMSDLFVVYDSVQYTKNDWRNRNQIASAAGPVWLTIPVATAGRTGQAINEATIEDRRWARKHWSTVSQTFARRPHFRTYRDEWEAAYATAQGFELLHDVNVHFLRTVARLLGIDTPLADDRDFELEPDSPTGKLVQLCLAVGADRYVTGPAGLDYLEVERFHEREIALDVIDYGHYPRIPKGPLTSGTGSAHSICWHRWARTPLPI
ncbi:MAG: WbqC family protein [Ilumatobacteraceae bacterium]